MALAHSRTLRTLRPRVMAVAAVAILIAGIGAGRAAAAPSADGPRALTAATQTAASQPAAASQPGPEQRGAHVPDQGRTPRRHHRETREPGPPSIERSNGRGATAPIKPAPEAREGLPSTGADLLLFLWFAGLLLVAGLALRVAIATDR